MRLLLTALALVASLSTLDREIQTAVQELRSPTLDRPMQAISDLGRPLTVVSALLGIAILDAAAGPATARLALFTLVPTNLVVEIIKRSVNRTRPDGERKPSNASFPSSHAANAFALAAVLARRWKKLAPGFWLLAVAVGWSRMYLNRHFATDVIVGAVIGIASCWALTRVWRTPPRPRAREAA
jgi:undecaprenyl-diphosphatase